MKSDFNKKKANVVLIFVINSSFKVISYLSFWTFNIFDLYDMKAIIFPVDIYTGLY